MKKFSIPIVLFLTLLFLACNNENLESEEVLQSENPNFRVMESTVNHNFAARASYDEPCLTTNLIAGQDFENPIGTVTIDSDGENIILTYDTSSSGWTIDLTHMSIGDCEQSIPTTGSGNPKVGRFEHTEPHTEDINKVVYMIDKYALIAEHELEDVYCFAAHAEVTGPNSEETAWAEGSPFDGNNWAMYVEALLSYCELDCQEPELDTDGDGTPDCEDLDQDGDGYPDKEYDENGNLSRLISYPPGHQNYDSNVDNCPKTFNPGQEDSERIYDEDGLVIGYLDGVGDACDNCQDIPNEDQKDLNGDGIGDACAPVK